MKKFFVLMSLVVALFCFSSCGVVGVVGAVYTGTTQPGAVTSNVIGSKVGTAKITSILGVVALGDGGINAAAKKAGISKISHVDVKTSSILGLYTTQEYFVYGE